METVGVSFDVSGLVVVPVSDRAIVVGVKGYQVMISTSKKFKKAKVKNYKKAKFTIKKLKANKKYFIRVRAYKVVNGEVYYGKWSNRKVKLKK